MWAITATGALGDCGRVPCRRFTRRVHTSRDDRRTLGCAPRERNLCGRGAVVRTAHVAHSAKQSVEVWVLQVLFGELAARSVG